jgi:hypothetical protein
MGAAPWVPLAEYVAARRAAGDDVIVNADPRDVLAFPSPSPGIGRAIVGWWRWRRGARRRLRHSGIDRIVVWDEVVAVLCCAARPKGVAVEWCAGSGAATTASERAVRAVVTRWADRVEQPADEPTRDDGGAGVSGWVVFGGASAPGAAALTALRARAAREPALALVFDARQRDTVAPAVIAALVEACDPRAVWWVGDDEWVRRLGGVPDEALDPHFDGTTDHRHARMGAGWRAV